MAIDLKASKVDTTNKGVTGLPDTPALTTEEMQKKFDELPLAAIKQLNNVIDDLVTLRDAITTAVGVVIPKTTALLRGDGQGGAVEALTDNEPTEDSKNPITSGAVYAALGNLVPEVVSVETEGDSLITIEDNHVYEISLGAHSLTLDVAELDGAAGAHVFLNVSSADAALTISGADYVYGDSLDAMGADQMWELSIYKKQIAAKNMTS